MNNNISDSIDKDENRFNSKTLNESIIKNRILKSVLTKKEREDRRKNMFNTIAYKGTIYIMGCGAISKALIYAILKIFIDVAKQIIVIDKRDLSNDINEFIKLGITFIQIEITKDNYNKIMSDVRKNDFIIDCAYGMSTGDFLNLCQEKGCHYISSSIDCWDYKNYKKPLDAALYTKFKDVNNTNKNIKDKKFNALIAMGCNPGNVSIWAKYGLDLINKKTSNIKYKAYAELSQKLGIEAIHVSEKDSQISNIPKKEGEYCNTWSTDAEAYYEETLGFTEGSYGTHEKTLPKNIIPSDKGIFVIDKVSINTQAQGYVPIYGKFIGNIVPHEECFTIGKQLTVEEKGKIKYKPTVCFIYHPCNDAKLSIEELKSKKYDYQEYYRLLTDEIVNGRDEVGVTFYLKSGKVYWVGSVLSVGEAREIFDNKFDKYINATICQVVAGYISGLLYLVEQIELIEKGETEHKGVIYSDDLPYKKILKWSLPFLGDFVFEEVENYTITKTDDKFTSKKEETNVWQFNNFLVE